MYGPSFQIKIEKGQEYDIPVGYSSKGYIYEKYNFVGMLRKQTINLWVFQNKNKTVLCEASLNSSGTESNNYRLDIGWNPIAWGDSLDNALEKYSAGFEWSVWGEAQKKELPDLGKYKK